MKVILKPKVSSMILVKGIWSVANELDDIGPTIILREMLFNTLHEALMTELLGKPSQSAETTLSVLNKKSQPGCAFAAGTGRFCVHFGHLHHVT